MSANREGPPTGEPLLTAGVGDGTATCSWRSPSPFSRSGGGTVTAEGTTNPSAGRVGMAATPGEPPVSNRAASADVVARRTEAISHSGATGSEAEHLTGGQEVAGSNPVAPTIHRTLERACSGLPVRSLRAFSGQTGAGVELSGLPAGPRPARESAARRNSRQASSWSMSASNSSPKRLTRASPRPHTASSAETSRGRCATSSRRVRSEKIVKAGTPALRARSRRHDRSRP